MGAFVSVEVTSAFFGLECVCCLNRLDQPQVRPPIWPLTWSVILQFLWLHGQNFEVVTIWLLRIFSQKLFSKKVRYYDGLLLQCNLFLCIHIYWYYLINYSTRCIKHLGKTSYLSYPIQMYKNFYFLSAFYAIMLPKILCWDGFSILFKCNSHCIKV